jgi:WD40 repeat protein
VSGAAEGETGVVSIWEVRKGTLVGTLEGHRGLIWDIEWSHAHKLLVSAGADGAVRWWDPRQGVNLETVQTHEAWARAVRVGSNGKSVASCGEVGVIKLWDMNSHRHLATFRAERPDISHTSGLTNAQQAALRALGAVGEEHSTPP